MKTITISKQEYKSLKSYMCDNRCYKLTNDERVMEFNFDGLAKIGLCPYSKTAKNTKEELANVLWNKSVLNNKLENDSVVIVVFDAKRFGKGGSYEADYWKDIDSIHNKINLEVA